MILKKLMRIKRKINYECSCSVLFTSFSFRLLGFISDYLIKRGFKDTVKSLFTEPKLSDSLIPRSKLPNLINSVNEIRGQVHDQNESVLFEWWRVFWNILKENRAKETLAADENYKNQKRVSSPILHPKPLQTESQTSVKYNNTTTATNTATTATSPSTSTTSSSTSSSNPYKKSKKKPIKCVENLDITSLTGIERSLTATGLMNKDLNKLTAEESEKISTALEWNRVSKESWEMYLKLCKEYQRTKTNVINSNNVNGSNNSIPHNNINISLSPNITLPNHYIPANNNTASSYTTGFKSSSIPINPHPHQHHQMLPLQLLKPPSNYLGVIDQMNQPIDSRQLLLLRQSLFQEYLKKQQQIGSTKMIYTDNNTGNIGNTENTNNNTEADSTDSTNVLKTNFNFFENYERDEELNFKEFMNEYLI